MRKIIVTTAVGALMALGTAVPAVAFHGDLPTDAFTAACDALGERGSHYCTQ